MKGEAIHIAAAGFEFDRVIAPIMMKYPAEKLILLKSDTSDIYPKANKLTENLVKKIENHPIDVQIKDTDIYSFNETFTTMIDILERYSNHKVFINISSAPKLALVAMISATFFMRERVNMKIFYVAPEEYYYPELLGELGELSEGSKTTNDNKITNLAKKLTEKGLGGGLKDITDIPIFPIQKINEIDKIIIDILDENGGVRSGNELLKLLNVRREKELQRSSLQYRLENLTKQGIIDRKKEKKGVGIELTDLGELYLKFS